MIAALLIGNELLSGQVEDQNLKYILDSFKISGHKLSEVRWVPDELKSISDSFRELSKIHQIVISSGGVGPTHDDVTIPALADAFNEKLICNTYLKQSLEKFYGDRFNDAAMRMAFVPESTVLVDKTGNNWPILCVKNCYVLPGVPQIFKQKFDRLLRLLPESKPFYSASFYLNSDEVFFADNLKQIQMDHPDILIGSYPVFGNQSYRTEITIKHIDLVHLENLYVILNDLFIQKNFLVKSFKPEKNEYHRNR